MNFELIIFLMCKSSASNLLYHKKIETPYYYDVSIRKCDTYELQSLRVK